MKAQKILLLYLLVTNTYSKFAATFITVLMMVT